MISKPVLKADRQPSVLNTPKPETPESFFQAIGVLYADVEMADSKVHVLIGSKSYQLGSVSKNQDQRLGRMGANDINHDTFRALRIAIGETGKKQRLIVYPYILHLPDRNTPHKLGFRLLGFQGQKPLKDSVTQNLKDFEFRLCGLWQYIPVCRYPVVTILRNFSDDMRSLVENLPLDGKRKWLKASHIPMLWNNPVVKPFRFNPKLDREEQGHPSFVQAIAKFVSSKDVFEFSALLGIPSEKAPRFLKLNKA